jgi:TRAP-type uncharacterized transport system substrate-binding protein
MRWRVLVILLVLVGALVGLVLWLQPWRSSGESLPRVYIATGGEGGTYIKLGSHFATILDRHSRIGSGRYLETSGSGHNLMLLLPEEFPPPAGDDTDDTPAGTDDAAVDPE